MSDNKSAASSGGIGFSSLLGILFIGLKLTHYIDWDWFYVLAPLWVPFAIVAAVLAVGFVVLILYHIFSWIFSSF